MIRVLLATTAILISFPVFAAKNPKLEVTCALNSVFEGSNSLGDVVKATIYFDAEVGHHVLEARTADSNSAPLVYWLTKFHHNRLLVHARDEHGDTYVDLELQSRDSLTGTIVLEQDFEFHASCEGLIDLSEF